MRVSKYLIEFQCISVNKNKMFHLVEGWGKESIRNISLYISDVNAQIFPKDFCQAYSMLLIVVCSAPANTNARQAVRETWGSQKTVLGERIELVFLMGKALEPSVQVHRY